MDDINESWFLKGAITQLELECLSIEVIIMLHHGVGWGMNGELIEAGN